MGGAKRYPSIASVHVSMGFAKRSTHPTGLRLMHEPDKERDLVLALCGRWGKLEHDLNGYLNLLDAREGRHAREIIARFSMYMKELQAVLTGTATPQSVIQAFGSGLLPRRVD